MTAPNQIRFSQAHSTGIMQKLDTGVAFDGTLPTGDTGDAGAADQNGLYKYPLQHNGGGLFVWNNYEPIIVTQLHVDLGDITDASLYVVNLDATGAVLTGESVMIHQEQKVRYIALDETHFRVVLLRNQALKLTSVSTGIGKPIAQAVAVLERTFQR